MSTATLTKPITATADLPEGLLVDVYWNLHKNVFSVRAVTSGLVIGHVHEVNLTDVKFRVQKAGRERVLREKRKNVHAFVRGNITHVNTPTHMSVRYNPYLADHFRQGTDGARVDGAATARLVHGAIMVQGAY